MGYYYKTQMFGANRNETIPSPFDKEIHAKLSLKLKEFIKEKYGNQKKLARLLGMSRSHLSLIISGKRRIPPELKQLLIRNGFDEGLIYNYIISDKIEPGTKDENIIVIFELKRIIDYQNNLLLYAERLIKELRNNSQICK